MHSSKPIIASFLILLLALPTFAQESELSVATIMQDPATYIGDWPSMPYWSEDGQTLYFNWNPMGAFESDSLFKITRDDLTPRQVPRDERLNQGPVFTGWQHGEHVYDADFSRKVYARGGDLYLFDRATNTQTRLTQTRDFEGSPRFALAGDAVIFVRDNNLYKLSLDTGALAQLTDLRSGQAPSDAESDDQDSFLETQQSELFEIVRQEQEEDELRESARERDQKTLDPPPTWYRGSRSISQLSLDPTERFVSFVTSSSPAQNKRTRAIDWVTESGYTEMLSARAKVGATPQNRALYIQDLKRDTTYQIDLHQLEGAYDVPEYLREEGVAVDSSESKRVLFSYGPFWSGDGDHAILEVRADDNKDRWLVRLDPATGTLDLLDRQHDEAWIAGPGISWFGGGSTGGWLPDNRHFYGSSPLIVR